VCTLEQSFFYTYEREGGKKTRKKIVAMLTQEEKKKKKEKREREGKKDWERPHMFFSRKKKRLPGNDFSGFPLSEFSFCSDSNGFPCIGSQVRYHNCVCFFSLLL
jgi:hypothetical protein